jgi:hypothetical protein
MSASEQLSEKTAKLFVKEWIDGEMPPMPKKRYIKSERRWLVDQMAEKCIQRTLKQDGGLVDLENQLPKITEIVDTIWYAGASAEAKSWIWQEENRTDEDEKKLSAQHRVWWRRDPKKSYNEGFESKDCFNCDPDEIKSVAALYLERPWLRVPKLDWIFVDILITRELCAYGESLKEKCLPGAKMNWLNMNPKYLSTKGNLKEMTKDRWKDDLRRSSWKTFYSIFLPIGLILCAFYFGYQRTGYSFVAIYAFLILDYVVASFRRSKYRRAGNRDLSLAPFELWDKMYEVWQRLQGPTVNPIRLKEALDESAKMGAAWDETIWAIVGRVIKIDDDVWVIQPSTDPY